MERVEAGIQRWMHWPAPDQHRRMCREEVTSKGSGGEVAAAAALLLLPLPSPPHLHHQRADIGPEGGVTQWQFRALPMWSVQPCEQIRQYMMDPEMQWQRSTGFR